MLILGDRYSGLACVEKHPPTILVLLRQVGDLFTTDDLVNVISCEGLAEYEGLVMLTEVESSQHRQTASSGCS